MNTFYKEFYPHNRTYICRCDRCHSSFEMGEQSTYKYCPLCGVFFEEERKARPAGYPRGAWDRGIPLKKKLVYTQVPGVVISYTYIDGDYYNPFVTDEYSRPAGFGRDYVDFKEFLKTADERNGRETICFRAENSSIANWEWLPVKKEMPLIVLR